MRRSRNSTTWTWALGAGIALALAGAWGLASRSSRQPAGAHRDAIVSREARAGSGSHGDDIAMANLRCAEGLPGAEGLDVRACLATLDRWAARVQAETDRHFYRFRSHPAEFENSEGYFRMLMMAVVLAEDFQVRYHPARMAPPGAATADDGFFADARDVFLPGLLGPQRLGTCSSLPVLYVALGRRLGYPLKLVTTKGHLFVRWEGSVGQASLPAGSRGIPAPSYPPQDSSGRQDAARTGRLEAYPTPERFNLEATGRGMNRYEDDHYKHWPFELTEAEIAANGFLKSLTPAEELAVFLAIRAQCLLEAGRAGEAMAAGTAAVRCAPATPVYQLLLADAERRETALLRKPPTAPAPIGLMPPPAHFPPGPEGVLPPDVAANPLFQIR